MKLRSCIARINRAVAVLAAMLLALVVTLADERQTIVVWGQGIGPEDKGFADAVMRFEEEFPQYRVQFLGMGAGQMNPQKLMTAIVGGSPPDVVRQDRFTISDWASRGAFRPLDDLIARDRGIDPRTPTPEQYYDSVWSEVMFEGQTFGIPLTTDVRILFWNREIFRERAADLIAAGLDPNRAPRTWSETLEYSRVLTVKNPDGSLKTAGFIPNFGNSWLYLYAFQNEGEFLSADGTRCTLTDPRVVEALQFMVDGYEILGGMDNATRFRAGFLGGADDPFLIGKVAMVIDGTWTIYGKSLYGPRMDYGVAPPPIPDDRLARTGRFQDVEHDFITWSGGVSYVIPAGASNDEGGWEFIKFMTSFEGRLMQVESQERMDRARGRVFVPSLSALIELNEAVRERHIPERGSGADALRLSIDLMPSAKIRPASFAAQVLWDEHVRATELACRGVLSPEQALLQSERRVQLYLDEHLMRDQYAQMNLGWLWWLAAASLAALATALILSFRSMSRHALTKKEAMWGWIFVAPWLIGFLVFTAGPMVVSAVFAFADYSVLNEPRYVGLKNFSDLFLVDGGRLAKAFSNVLYLTVIGVPLGIFSGLGIAILLNAGVRGLRFYRTAFYLPAIVPTVAATLLWVYILNADPNRGLINKVWQGTIGEWFGTQAPGWLSSPEWAKPALIVMGLWGVGGGMILWLAGLKGVPKVLYEAARIDGAAGFNQFKFVTWPQLTPLIFFNVVMGLIGAIQQFDTVYVATSGTGTGPSDSLLLPVYLLFDNAFSYFRMGYASALAWLIFAIIVVVTAFQFKLAPRWVHYEVDD